VSIPWHHAKKIRSFVQTTTSSYFARELDAIMRELVLKTPGMLKGKDHPVGQDEKDLIPMARGYFPGKPRSS
jgi:hypothetical protein